MLTDLIRSESHLLTSPEAICDGFLEQAKAKRVSQRASDYVKEARKLYDFLKKSDHIPRLDDVPPNIYDSLIAAAGFSDKARGLLSKQKQKLASALTEFLEDIEKKDQKDWLEEIAYRLLLTRGDALGG